MRVCSCSVSSWLAFLAGTLLLFAPLSGRTAAADGQAMDSNGTEVSGRVSVRGNGPLPIVLVQLRHAFGGLIQSTETDTFGGFSFQQVPVGEYAIVIRAPGYQPVNQLVEVGAAPILDLMVTLRPDGSGAPLNSFAKGSGSVSVRQLLIPGKALDEYHKAFKSAARGKTDDAIKHWQKSIKIFPQYAESYMQLSKVYVDRGDFARATEAAGRAVDIDPKSADAYEYLGYAYLKEKDFPKARDAFANAVKLSDSDWLSQFWLGQLLLNEKDAQGAYPHLRLASQLNPRVPEIEIALYDDLLMLGRPKEALAEIDDFLTRFPNSPLAAEARVQRNHLATSLDGKQR